MNRSSTARGFPLESSKSQSIAARRIWCRRYNSTGPGFPNKGQSLRRTSSGALVPYYDRGEILDGALDGQHLEICWIKNQTDALVIQIQGSARVRLEDGAMLRINYDAHNGYPFVPVSRILIERNIIPRAGDVAGAYP